MIRHNHTLEPSQWKKLIEKIEFLTNRMEEQTTINWAIELKSEQWLEKLSIINILESKKSLREPWLSAWQIIEESWQYDPENGDYFEFYKLNERIQSGERSGILISSLTKIVAPYLELNRQHFELQIQGEGAEHLSENAKPLFSPRFNSGELIPISELNLDKIIEVSFLSELAYSLETAINKALYVAQRLGSANRSSLWIIGEVKRVYYTSRDDNLSDTNSKDFNHKNEDPDQYAKGIAPSVKLLFEVVDRIASINERSARKVAKDIFTRWYFSEFPIYQRLWAAMAIRHKNLIKEQQIARFLFRINSDLFWKIENCEISELRAHRYKTLNKKNQNKLVAKILKGPPNRIFNKWVNTKEIEKLKRYFSISELRRIENGGGILPDKVKSLVRIYLEEQNLYPEKFKGLLIPEMEAGQIYFDFKEGTKVSYVPPNPNPKYDSLDGVERLRELEKDLSNINRSWENDPAGRARDWITLVGNSSKILTDFETTENGGDDYPHVWLQFGWAFRPNNLNSQSSGDNAIASRVLNILKFLSPKTLEFSVDGITSWMDAWSHSFRELLESLFIIWTKIWPIAASRTNTQAEKTDEFNLSIVASSNIENVPQDLDTFNTPIGKLAGVFLRICPPADSHVLFPIGSIEQKMREQLVNEPGRSGLIAKHRLIECLNYFVKIDKEWAEKNLIAHLRRDDEMSLALWRAVARRPQNPEVRKLIGEEMLGRAIDPRLWPATRRLLVSSLVIDSLYALLESKDSAVNNDNLRHMIRTLDVDIRFSVANTIRRFVNELIDENRNASELYLKSAKIFIEKIWPKELHLVTASVSSEFAQLPAACGESFADAVETVERYLIPFESWSLIDYGFYNHNNEDRSLKKIIDNAKKAAALLKLLDLTIGKSDGARFPYDITAALEQIEKCDQDLATDFRFQRLATAARR